MKTFNIKTFAIIFVTFQACNAASVRKNGDTVRKLRMNRSAKEIERCSEFHLNKALKILKKFGICDREENRTIFATETDPFHLKSIVPYTVRGCTQDVSRIIGGIPLHAESICDKCMILNSSGSIKPAGDDGVLEPVAHSSIVTVYHHANETHSEAWGRIKVIAAYSCLSY